MIDQKSGHQTRVFEEYPHISPNQKHIICLYANPYEMTADVELYAINNDSIQSVVNVSFKNWVPAVERENLFWNADGYLYLAVNHIKSFWTLNGNINEQYQYMRLKVDIG